MTNRPAGTARPDAQDDRVYTPEEFERLLDPNHTHFAYGRATAIVQYRRAHDAAALPREVRNALRIMLDRYLDEGCDSGEAHVVEAWMRRM